MLTGDVIQAALHDAGIAPGDTLVVHSSLRAIGPVIGGADAIIDAFLTLLGPGGTLAMPAFNYSQPAVLPWFDAESTPARTGALCEAFRKRPSVRRSLHPTHSMAVLGPDAAAIVADHMDGPTMGVDSPLARLARRGGWVLLLGVTHTANSTIHVGESFAEVFKQIDGAPDSRIRPIRMPDGSIREHRLDPSASCSAAFNAVDLPLRRARAIRDFRLGQGPCMLMRGQAVIDAVKSLVNESPEALRCTNPECRWCAGSRGTAVPK